MKDFECDLESVYPTPVLRATSISRMQEKRLGRLNFDADTARFLGEENIGVFAGGCDNLDRLIDRLRVLDSCGTGGQWVVVSSTQKMAAVVRQKWQADATFVAPGKMPMNWSSQRVEFAVPESLEELACEIKESATNVAGIIVLDMFCTVHKARGFANGGFRVQHDRPQLIVNFRSQLGQGQWMPPLVFCAQKPAKSINTNAMLSPYCLEAFRYVDGATLRTGQPPAELSEQLPSYYGNALTTCGS